MTLFKENIMVKHFCDKCGKEYDNDNIIKTIDNKIRVFINIATKDDKAGYAWDKQLCWACKIKLCLRVKDEN